MIYLNNDSIMSDNDTKIALLNQGLNSMEKRFDKLEEILAILPEKLEAKFATKAEHIANTSKINFINKILGSIGGLVLVSIVGALLNLVLK